MTLAELEVQMQPLITRGFCWLLGHSRLASHMCQIYPLSQTAHGPVVTGAGPTFEQAIQQALDKLGDAKPND